MAVRNAPQGPYVIQANLHNAESFRQVVQSLVATSGVVNAGDLAVSANGTPNMSVNVASGFVFVPGSQSVPSQGTYHVDNDATVNLTIAASNSSNPRIDLVVASIQDAAYSGTQNQGVLQVVTGVAAASPVAPSAPANSVILAQVAVGTGVGSITSGNITDKRTFAESVPRKIVPVKQIVTSSVSPSTTSGAAVEIDTSLRCTIVVPASGRLRVHQAAVVAQTGACDVTLWAQVSGVTSWQATGSYSFPAAGTSPVTGLVVITGLTPGSTATVLMGWSQAGGTATINSSTRGGAQLGTWQFVAPD